MMDYNSKYLNFDSNNFELNVKIQQGPIQEEGVNGCQIDDVIVFARGFINLLNKEFPCRENALVITKLEEAEMWLKRRKEDREKRGVEGFNKV